MHNPVPAPPTTARRGRFALLGVAAVVSLALSACSSPLDRSSLGGSSPGDWRSADRCKPQESPAPGDSPADGPALSPREILPDPSQCPEAYRGSDRPSGAPPISRPEPDPPYTYPSPNIDHRCADVEAANGFPCKSVPGTGRVIYPGAPGLDTDPPQIPDY